MMDLLLDRFGVSMPMADLLSGNPYEVLTRNVKSGRYAGLEEAGDAEYHHLVFTQDNIDWQVWLTTDDATRLHKMVIAYKNMPSVPRYTLRVENATFVSEIAPDTFVFTPPAGAEKIDFHPIKDME